MFSHALMEAEVSSQIGVDPTREPRLGWPTETATAPAPGTPEWEPSSSGFPRSLPATPSSDAGPDYAFGAPKSVPPRNDSLAFDHWLVEELQSRRATTHRSRDERRSPWASGRIGG